MRCGDRAVMASSRSIDSIRCAPRLVAAIAWISSMMTVSTLTSVSAADDVNIRYRLSGVVMSRSTGWRSKAWRSRADVSPVRIATVGWMNGTPSRSAARPMPINGARRFFSMSKARARNGEMYNTRVRRFGSAAGVVHSRSIDARNAVRVLPLPVGAHTNVCEPLRMAGQPSICGVVGSGNDAANQARTAGENASSTG
jgi:hypothetical protein